MKHCDVSVIIPTRNRLLLLAEAIASALEQTWLPEEIIIGDDSDDPTANKSMITLLSEQYHFKMIRHLTGATGSQAANVERLINASRQSWICLLHDDDLLLPRALETMLHAARQYQAQHGTLPILVYGMQELIDADGRGNAETSRTFNATYHRTSSPKPDLAANPTLAAIVQQSPNDGYLVDRQSAVTAGYNSDARVGLACDFAFAFHLSKLGAFCYVPEAVAKYRLSEHSVLRGRGKSSDDTGIGMYFLLKRELPAALSAEPLVRRVLCETVKTAVDQLWRHDRLNTAWRVFFSSEHLVSCSTARFWVRGIRLTVATLRWMVRNRSIKLDD